MPGTTQKAFTTRVDPVSAPPFLTIVLWPLVEDPEPATAGRERFREACVAFERALRKQG